MDKLYYNPNQEKNLNELLKVSNPKIVIKNAQKYFNNPNIKVYLSTRKDKKYSIINPKTNKFIHFGQMHPPMEDFTFHSNLQRRDNYLARTANIRGSWKNDKYSANNLARILLWDAPF
jgi:hypothetical protein